MLVLARHVQESIMVFCGDEVIKVQVLSITGNIVRLGVVASPQVGIFREEICGQAEAEKGSFKKGA